MGLINVKSFEDFKSSGWLVYLFIMSTLSVFIILYLNTLVQLSYCKQLDLETSLRLASLVMSLQTLV